MSDVTGQPRVCPECDEQTFAPVCPNDGRPTVDAARLKVRAPPDPMIGKIIEDRFVVESRLGRGGFGAVYLAKHSETGGLVALKLLRADMAGSDQAVRRFYVEAQNTHRLRHPNTVRVSDFGQTDDGVLYLAMEYVAGRPLSAVLDEEQRLSPSRTVRVVEQVLKSLAEAHANQVIHRDIKPENIMLLDQVGEPDFVKVLDFGISRSLDGSGAQTNGPIGTPRYMAPEQWRGGRLDGRTDLYSVGCLAYEMLAGTTPFRAYGPGEQQLVAYMNAHIYEHPTPLLQLTPGVCPEPLADFVMALLAKKPGDRPDGAEVALARLIELRTTGDLPTALQGDVIDGRTKARVRVDKNGGLGAGPPPLNRVSHGRPGPPAAATAGPDDTAIYAPAAADGADERAGDGGREGGDTTVFQPGAAGARAPSAHTMLSNTRETGSFGRLPMNRLWLAVAAVLLVLGVLAYDFTRSARTPAAEPARAAALVSEPVQPSAAAEGDAASEVPPPRPLEPAPARVRLRTHPPDAEVMTATGRSLGRTPLTITSPPLDDSLEVVVKAPSYRPLNVTLAFPAPGKELPYSYTLEPYPVVEIRSTPPGASVTILGSDRRLGSAPLHWTLRDEELLLLEEGEALRLRLTWPDGRTMTHAVGRSLLQDDGLQAIDVSLPEPKPAARARSDDRPRRRVAPGARSKKRKAPKPPAGSSNGWDW